MVAAAVVVAKSPTGANRLEASPVQRYRLIKHSNARWDVQAEIGTWHSVYSDDSARRAFEELKRRVKLGGCVVCARCGWEVHPRLRDGQVLCEVCYALAEPVSWLSLLAMLVIFGIWLAVMCYLDHLIHLVATVGGAR